jgi:hypothetical protein
MTWDALLEQWPWFGAAAAVLVVAVGLFIALKPKPMRQAESDPDTMGWMPTGRIDFSNSNPIGKFMLEVEETRSTIGSTGVEHREIRWRSATVNEAKMVLESYNALRNLALTATFTVSTPTRTKISRQGGTIETELKDAGKDQEMADVTLVPKDVTH